MLLNANLFVVRMMLHQFCSKLSLCGKKCMICVVIKKHWFLIFISRLRSTHLTFICTKIFPDSSLIALPYKFQRHRNKKVFRLSWSYRYMRTVKMNMPSFYSTLRPTPSLSLFPLCIGAIFSSLLSLIVCTHSFSSVLEQGSVFLGRIEATRYRRFALIQVAFTSLH